MPRTAYWYCYQDLPNWIEGYHWSLNILVDAQCWITEFDGCSPMGYEPPTYIDIYCDCALFDW